MKKQIAKVLVLVLLLSFNMVYADSTGADAVTSATGGAGGSSAAPAATPAKPANAAPSNGPVYTVKAGDMLWKIAEKHNLTLEQLMTLNPQLKNPNSLFVGQKIAVGKTTAPAAAAVNTLNTKKVYQGLGKTVAFRKGPGKDSQDVQVYSFSVSMASALFDADGRIIDVYIDAYEVATPNYDGASMPHFSGWPDKEGYNVTDHDTAKVTGVSVNTSESVAAEVNGWKTKRERGDAYHMNPANEWYKQMDFFQKFFVGKTVEELEAWFAKNTTAAGRPIKASTTKQDELDKLAKLTDAEKAELAEVVAGATMSVRDAHGDFLGAIADAYKNRVEVVIPVK